MTMAYLQLDEAGWVIAAFEAPDESLDLTACDQWSGWVGQHSWQRPRLVQGVLSWHDPRTLEQRSNAARAERDALLAATDWRVTRALEQGVPVPADWAAYRQQLRDLPQQPGFPDDINWPTPPESTP